MSEDLHIVILAAGLSQRLGFPKQLILKNGITLLEEKIRLALALSNNVSVVIPNIDTPWAKQISDICSRFPVQIVLNPTPQTGMARSIQLAFTDLIEQKLSVDTRVLFLTIDQVALNGSCLDQLTQTVTSTTIIASNYGEPAMLGIPVNMPFGFLAKFVPQLQGDKGFGKILNQIAKIANAIQSIDPIADYHILAIDLPELAWDIDTIEQFEVLKVALGVNKGNYHLA